jgi:hypothetical protein
MISLRTIAKILSSPIAFPGILFILYGFGVDHTHLLGPPGSPTVDEKFRVTGLPPTLFPPISVAVGLLKVTVLLNNTYFKSKTLSKVLFYISVPGFALVAHSHNLVGLPMQDNVPCVVMPLLLGIIAFSDEEKSKEKRK